MNILLCTLGASWAVIPEIYGFLAPGRLDLFRDHPDAATLGGLREEFQLGAPDEIWVCTTEGGQTRQGLEFLRQWRLLLPVVLPVRVWTGAGTDQLASQEECRALRELVLRVCLLAREKAGEGQVVLSLAGGRKTMSADMQWAGSLLGCAALVHVVGREPLPAALKGADPGLMSRPLIPELAADVMPVVVAPGQRSELLEIDRDGLGPVSSGRFTLPLASDDSEPCCWSLAAGETWLERELREREREGTQLLGNYLAEIGREERHENWRSLYRLPPRIINRLRVEIVGEADADFLTSLPKADLHRHLGGCLTIEHQRRVGQAIWRALNEDRRDQALRAVEDWLQMKTWPGNWAARLRMHEARGECAAALLVHASDRQLRHNLYEVTEPRVNLKATKGFWAYERPGELSGSVLLSHSAAVEAYAEAIIEQAVAEGLAYVELRGSPHKYGDGIEFLRRLQDGLQRAAARCGDLAPLFRFIVIVDRRQLDGVDQVVEMTVAAHKKMPEFIAGLDLAGDEGTSCPAELSSAFMLAFEACLPLTIHAGEGEDAESIWQATYHLHADRIGHGLTIGDHAALATRFRDRGICLELCPTSNREVVGYADPALPATASCPSYPLSKLWHQGLPLTICTDNPGISRTSLASEFITASRMTKGGLSWWDTLAIMKQAFTHAFLPSDEKERLLKKVDATLYQAVARRWLSHARQEA